MEPQELKRARLAFGLSAKEFARLVGGLEAETGGRTVRRWEAGDSPIPGSVAKLVNLALSIKGVRKFLKLQDPDYSLIEVDE